MPGPSPSWQTVPVFGKYRKIDGSAYTGSLVFTFATRVVSNTDDIIFPAGSKIEVALDSNGAVNVPLPAVDDPDNSPSNWSIKVEEKLNEGGGLTYYIQPILSMLPTGLNLRTLPFISIGTPTPALVKGVRGGVAALDADGDVVDAEGAKVTAGSTTEANTYTDTQISALHSIIDGEIALLPADGTVDDAAIVNGGLSISVITGLQAALDSLNSSISTVGASLDAITANVAANTAAIAANTTALASRLVFVIWDGTGTQPARPVTATGTPVVYISPSALTGGGTYTGGGNAVSGKDIWFRTT